MTSRPATLAFPPPSGPFGATAWHALRELFLKTFDSQETRRAYARAVDEFFDWYTATARSGDLTRSNVAEWRAAMVDRGLGAASINLRLAAIRRLATEAAEQDLITLETAASIGRVRGVRVLGQRLGNWLTLKQAQALLRVPDRGTVIGVRDHAILALLVGCGLRRSEVARLTVEQIQERENRWCIIDLVGKHHRIRTVPIPGWVKESLDSWVVRGGIVGGRVFRAVDRTGRVYGDRISEKVIYRVVEKWASAITPGIAPHDLRRTCAKLCRSAGGELEQIQILLGHASIQTTERYLGTAQDLVCAPNDAIRLK